MAKTSCISSRGKSLFSLLSLATLSVSSWGGTTIDSRFKSPVEVSPEPSPWEFQVSAPIWLPNLSGNVGLRGRSAHLDVDTKTILGDTQAVAAFNFQVRNGRWGLTGDFNYLGTEQKETSRYFDKLNLRADQTITSLDLSYRVWESERAWVEVYAGARYMSLYNRLELQPNTKAIEEATERWVERAWDRVKGEIREAIRDLEGRDPEIPIPPLTPELKEELAEIVETLKNDPELRKAIISKNKARIKAAKERVRHEMTQRIKKALNRNYSINNWWIDPYVGLQTQINLTKAFYLKAKGDVGGFGVGSDFAWSLYAGVGVNITRHLYSEVGYRHLYSDYRHQGFVYDMTIQGAQITVGVNF